MNTGVIALQHEQQHGRAALMVHRVWAALLRKPVGSPWAALLRKQEGPAEATDV